MNSKNISELAMQVLNVLQNYRLNSRIIDFVGDRYSVFSSKMQIAENERKVEV